MSECNPEMGIDHLVNIRFRRKPHVKCKVRCPKCTMKVVLLYVKRQIVILASFHVQHLEDKAILVRNLPDLGTVPTTRQVPKGVVSDRI